MWWSLGLGDGRHARGGGLEGSGSMREAEPLPEPRPL